MEKKAIFLDLDNTIYPVISIGNNLFAPILDLLNKYIDNIGKQRIDHVRQEIMRKPFQLVCQEANLPKDILKFGMEYLRKIELTENMNTFPDYVLIKTLPLKKFLITKGFRNLQNSKINQLRIRGDFDDIFIIDPEYTNESKQDIFLHIMDKHGLKRAEILVIGDDPYSEIAAGKALGLTTIMYSPCELKKDNLADFQISNYAELINLLNCKEDLFEK